MSKIPDPHYEALEKQIADSLQKACAFKDKLRRTSSRFTITNILFGALATFVAGRAVLMSALFPTVSRNWALSCTVAGTFALGATIVAGLQKQLADPEVIAEASECCGRLKNLKVQTIGRQYDWEKVRNEYGSILEGFSRLDV